MRALTEETEWTDSVSRHLNDRGLPTFGAGAEVFVACDATGVIQVDSIKLRSSCASELQRCIVDFLLSLGGHSHVLLCRP